MIATERDWAAIAAKLQNETVMPVTKAAKLIPTTRGRRGYCSASTLVRWMLDGKFGVHLEGYYANGSTWWTSTEAIARFMGEVSRVKAGDRRAIPSPTQEDRRSRQALDRLRERLNRKKS